MALAKRGSTKGKEVVRRFWEEAFNHANAEVVGDIISHDFKLEDLATGWKLNRANVEELVDGVQDNLRKPHVEVVDQFPVGADYVVSRLIFRALPVDNFQENAELVEMNAVTIDKIVDDHVVDSKLMWDASTADEQLRPDDSGDLDWRFPWW